MKKIINSSKFTSVLLALCMVTTVVLSSCNKNAASVDADIEAEGWVELSISIPETRALTGDDYTTAMEQSVLKIYDANGSLVRRYEPATEVPDQVYMVSGDYTVSVLVGNSTPATFDSEDRTFYGESDFTISASQSSSVDIDCNLYNHTVAVEFDESLNSNLEAGYEVVVLVANEYSDEAAASSTTSKLIYTEDNVGYFIVDGEDVTSLAWCFSGAKSSDGSAIVKSGVISNPSAQSQTTLTFSYSSSLQVSSISIKIDDTLLESNDDFSFSPQPTISGIDFDLDEVQVADGSSFSFTVNSLNDLSDIDVDVDGTLISPFVGGEVVDVADKGVSYVAESATSGTLTIDAELFNTFTMGGTNNLYIKLYDVVNSQGGGTMEVMTTGVTGASNLDLWNNTATLNALVTTSDPTNVVIKHRTSGDTDWIETAATAGTDGAYSILTEATWTQSTNSNGNTIYQLNQGIRHGVKIEYCLVVDGLELPVATFTPSGTAQTIPNSDMNSSSIPCFSDSSSSSSTWCSGNNTYTSKLCSQGTRDGATCAVLATTSALGVIAAGNLIYGQFDFNYWTSTGTVSFGQSYTWATRPNSLKFKYSASLGTVSSSGSKLSSGDTDIARVYVAIVDWSSRHDVSAGTSGASSSQIWDPESDTSVSEGNIIGYGSFLITASTSGETMYQAETPIYYYDYVTRPTSNITLVISAASSAYGDYLEGASGSTLYLDDFEFGY